jgi:hypothetical protein
MFYRVYFIGDDNHIHDSQIIDCDTDDSAIEKAATLLNGSELEVWERSRMIVKLTSSGEIARIPA